MAENPRPSVEKAKTRPKMISHRYSRAIASSERS